MNQLNLPASQQKRFYRKELLLDSTVFASLVLILWYIGPRRARWILGFPTVEWYIVLLIAASYPYLQWQTWKKLSEWQFPTREKLETERKLFRDHPQRTELFQQPPFEQHPLSGSNKKRRQTSIRHLLNALALTNPHAHKATRLWLVGTLLFATSLLPIAQSMPYAYGLLIGLACFVMTIAAVYTACARYARRFL